MATLQRKDTGRIGDQSRDEQKAASDYVRDAGPDVRGAMQGFADWCVEEQYDKR
jgi:hypothetical protein